MAKDMGLTVKKSEDFSEWYSQIIQKADLADIRFGIQGFIVHKPWGFMIIRKIYEYLEKEVEKQGHLPYYFPRVVKETDLMREKEHAGFTPEVFWVNEAGDKKIEERFALPPTGEAQIYPMYSKWLRSYRDLPYKAYQSRISVYRNEMTTRAFLRGREFLFFETHDVFKDHQGILDQIKEDIGTCETVIRDKIKIPFYFFKRPVWDKFMGADGTFTADTLMPDGKRNQLASTHDFGQKFAMAYDIKVKDKDELEKYVWQTAFGPGIWRIMAAIIGVHGDDQGLVLPFDMAPVQVVIVPITFSKKEEDNQKVLDFCKELEADIKMEGYRVKLDDREDTPGMKYNDWEMKGVPIRLEIGPKEIENKEISLVLRTGREREKVHINELDKVIAIKSKELDAEISRRAEKYFNNNVRSVESFGELKSVIEVHKGFVKAPFCSVDKKGEPCEIKMKEETNGGRVCGTLYPKEDSVNEGQKCVVCGKDAKHIVYIAKSY